MYNSGRRGKRANDGYGILSQADRFNQTEYPIPIVTSFAVTNGSYVPLDDTAADTAGGQTIVVYGSGFAPGATIMVGGSTIGSVTYLDQGRLTFTSPANVSGSYTIIVMNANGGTGILVPGLVYSGVPTWETSAGSVGTQYERTNVSSTFVATGDAPVTYSVLSGSLPPGTSLSPTGVLSGAAPAESGSTTYSFTIRASDGQLQDSDRSFSLTVNTDVVTWSTPTNNQVISAYEYAPISNVTASATSAAGYGVVYSANSVPTGITVNANTGVISGTVNTVGNTFTRLTATANTTTKTAIRDVVFNINQDVVTWNSPADATQYTLTGGSPISNVSLSATSAAGFGVQYTANALPAGLSISGSVITGTPTTAETVTTLLTATANTTNRSATRTISWSISLGDLNWKNTVLLLSANTPAPSFINDSSNNNLQLTLIGDTRPINSDPYMGGYYSNFFDGTGDFLTVPNSAAFAFGTGDFTIEFWMRANIISGTTNGNIVGYSAAGSGHWNLMLYLGNLYWQTGQGVSNLFNVSIVPYSNIWTHYAIVRVSGTTRLYINGVQQASGADTTNYTVPTATLMYIGYNSELLHLTGHISNLRIIKGTGLYTAAFTPPTSPLTAVANTQLLTCQSNRLIDNSLNNLTVTKNGDVTVNSSHPFDTPTTVAYNNQYSVYFDGTGDYLTIADNAAFEIESNVDFTVEAWFNATVLPGIGSFGNIISKGASGVYQPYYIFVNSSGALLYYSSSNNSSWDIASGVSFGTVVANRWYHVAVSRQGTNTRLFLNGALINTITNSGAALVNNTRSVAIAARSDGTEIFTGFISNARIVKGTAVYTGAFTPSTAPLTAITNTSLLTCQDSTIKDNSPNAFAVTGTADARPVAVSPFTMTTANTTITNLGSGYFDGTGDYLTLNIPLVPATGNFTIECWIYSLTAAGSSQRAVYTQFASAQAGRFMFGIDQTSSSRIWLHYNGADYVGTSGKIVANAWTHIALVRIGDVFDMYVNGVKDRTDTFTGASLYQGAQQIAGAGTSFIPNAYISDLRIVSGTALYTNNFLPPQTPLTPIANTQILTLQTNGGANNTGILDQSSFNNIVSRFGNATQGTFSPYSQTGWSNYYPALAFNTYAANPIGTFGTGATFTVEGWVNMAVYPTTNYFFNLLASCDQSTLSYWNIGIGSTGLATIYWFDGNAKQVAGSTTLARGVWYHVAFVVTSGVVTIYVNGSQQTLTGTTTLTNPTGNASFTTGTDRGASNGGSAGYISNLRTSTTSVYTSTFTPSTTPLSPIISSNVFSTLLTSQSNRFIDNSPISRTITLGSTSPRVQAFSPFGGVTSVPTSYSAYFDGTGDYLTVPGSSNFVFAGDYTIEAWIYSSSTTWSVYSTGGSGAADQFSCDTGTLYWAYNIFGGGTANFFTSADVNKWTHVAACRSSGTTRLFKNGVVMATSTTNTSIGSTNTVNIGRRLDGVYLMNGYISNFRIVRGTALYTGAFTIPTSPLTAVANTLLLTCQSSTMIDNSTNNFSVTSVGDSKPVTFNPFGQTNTKDVSYSPSVNGGSMFFDGTGDYLTVPSSATIFGTMAYTIEFWIYRTAAPALARILENGTNTTNFSMDLSATGFFTINNNTTIAGSTSTLSVPLNAWTHVALVRTSTGTSGTAWYINGVAAGTFTHSIDIAIGTTMQIARSGGGSHLTGYLSDLRFTQGAALYTSSFVPPVSPLTPTTTIGNTRYTSSLLLTGTSGGVIDYHGTNILETVGNTQLTPEDPYSGNYYSNQLINSSDTWTISGAGTPLQLTGDFTVEFWIYPTNATGTYAQLLSKSGGNSESLKMGLTGSSWYIYFFNGTSYDYSTAIIQSGRWHHIVWERSGTTSRMYVNGVGQTAVTTMTATVDWSTLYWGASTGSEQFFGYMSNLRIIKGQCLYDIAQSTLTVPTSPLTAVSGTSLLTCQSNSFIDRSTNAFTITRSGATSVKSFNPFQRNAGKSIYFDGTGDYLFIPNATPSLAFGTGDFTVETWVYITSMTAPTNGNPIFDTRPLSTNGAYFTLFFTTGGVLTYYTNSNNAITSSALTAGQWYHVAVSRVSGSTRMFVNGTQAGTTFTDSVNYIVGTSAPLIGLLGFSRTDFLNGYLKDFRITQGVGRYTTTFTPPTIPLDVK